MPCRFTLSAASTAAPLPSRNRTTSRCPFCAAGMRAVFPSCWQPPSALARAHGPPERHQAALRPCVTKPHDGFVAQNCTTAMHKRSPFPHTEPHIGRGPAAGAARARNAGARMSTHMQIRTHTRVHARTRHSELHSGDHRSLFCTSASASMGTGALPRDEEGGGEGQSRQRTVGASLCGTCCSPTDAGHDTQGPPHPGHPIPLTLPAR